MSISNYVVNMYFRFPRFTQEFFLSCYGLSIRLTRYNRHFYKHLDLLSETSGWERGRLEGYQLEELKRMLKHAELTVPYWRRLFTEVAFDPSSMASVNDLKKLPVLTKREIVDNYDDLQSEDPKSRVVQVHTSGSTGTPLKINTTPYAVACEYASVWNHRMMYGVKLHDWQATFNGRLVCNPKSTQKYPFRKNYVGRQTLFSSAHVDEPHLEKMLNELVRGPYTYYVGYPSFIGALALYALKAGIHPKGVKAVFTSSESLSDQTRQLIEEAFECPVADYYGSAEQVGSMCQYSTGSYKQCMEDSVVELVEADEGVRINCSTLNNYAMPLFRYDIGDLVEMDEESNPMERLSVKRILGREDDVVVLPSGREVGRLDHIFKGVANIAACQIVQESLESVTFKIIPTENFCSEDQNLLLKNASLRLEGVNDLKVELTDNLVKSKSGKLKGVISHLKT